jgi:hypothetical protein
MIIEGFESALLTSWICSINVNHEPTHRNSSEKNIGAIKSTYPKQI